MWPPNPVCAAGGRRLLTLGMAVKLTSQLVASGRPWEDSRIGLPGAASQGAFEALVTRHLHVAQAVPPLLSLNVLSFATSALSSLPWPVLSFVALVPGV